MQDKILFDAQIMHLPLMLRWIRDKLRELPMTTSDKNKLEVVSEEILVNIIHYAYQDKVGKIEIVWIEKKPLIHIRFKDFGNPFNPLVNEKPPIKSLSIDAKEIGGLGIFFIKNLVDKIEYSYENNANILTVSKNVH
jgi:anti-sigma regulatory factor (Ser/Thr protein kinase)